jgi:peptidyl-prolyl cis-trans isomerase A (cyclophilin A)
MKLRKDWAPIGAERFEKLTEVGFWNEARSFRVLPGFIVQFGINGDPATQALWRKPIGDDAVKVSNKRGTVTFATAGANTRTTQIFFNTGNNGRFYLEEESMQLRCLDSLICSFFYFSVP